MEAYKQTKQTKALHMCYGYECISYTNDILRMSEGERVLVEGGGGGTEVSYKIRCWRPLREALKFLRKITPCAREHCKKFLSLRNADIQRKY